MSLGRYGVLYGNYQRLGSYYYKRVSCFSALKKNKRVLNLLVWGFVWELPESWQLFLKSKLLLCLAEKQARLESSCMGSCTGTTRVLVLNSPVASLLADLCFGLFLSPMMKPNCQTFFSGPSADHNSAVLTQLSVLRGPGSQ